jgi:hypothetical protein
MKCLKNGWILIKLMSKGLVSGKKKYT